MRLTHPVVHTAAYATLSLTRSPPPQMVNRVRVCTSSWTVLGLDQPLCGDTESWEMRGWRSWQQQG